MFGAEQRSIIEKLGSHAAAIVGLDQDAIRQRTRSREYSWTRFAVMNEARRRGCSLSAIGRTMGMDHTSVMHGVRRANEIAAVDTDMCCLLIELRAVQ